jgi:2-polyprenyl-3-methyl-5-hydroxy-6-metoxy-1,4-benzoquinol methylase
MSEGLVGAGGDAGWPDRPAGLAAVEQFNAIYRANPGYYGARVPADFREFLADRSVDSLNCLDLGAGQGRYALHLARAGARVRAVDRSGVAMAQLAERADAERLAISTEEADLCVCDFSAGEYDLVVCSTVLDHLDGACRHRLAAAIADALKPGGLVYCEVFTTADPGWRRQPEQSISETAGPVRHYFAAGELRGLFPRLTHLAYREGLKRDRAHGAPHWHGLALLVGRKE